MLHGASWKPKVITFLGPRKTSSLPVQSTSTSYSIKRLISPDADLLSSPRKDVDDSLHVGPPSIFGINLDWQFLMFVNTQFGVFQCEVLEWLCLRVWQARLFQRSFWSTSPYIGG